MLENKKGKKKKALILLGIRSELQNVCQTYFKKGTWKCLTQPTREIATHTKAGSTWVIYLTIL